MLTTPNKENQGFQQALSELARLRRFTGPPAEFWPAYLAASAGLIGAARGLLIVRDPAQPERLKKLGEWAVPGHADRSTLGFNRSVPETVDKAVQDGSVTTLLENGPTPDTHAFAVAAHLPLPGATEQCVATFLLLEATREQAGEAMARLLLAADVPTSYRHNQEATQARSDVEKFASVLDVMVLVNAERRFLAAAMAFCNGLATRYSFDRVSLGWLDHGYVRLKAISRTERFDRNMSAVKALEVVMEEALDQNEEVVFPVPDGVNLVSRDHTNYSREQGVAHLCSVPVRVENKAVAVLTCERAGRPVSQTELQQLRLACDQAAPRLSDLYRRDRWFGARWAALARERLAKFLGPEHTWAKATAVLVALLLLALCLPVYPYRVEGNFILRSDELAFITGPFDGYISQVNVRPGDVVKKGDVLLKLDTADLELEEASTLADQTRYIREAEKARAEAEKGRSALNRGSSGLAEMRIAQALVDQTQARLELIRHRLNQASVKALVDGVIAEGDLRQRLGAPVKQGEAFFKLARIDALYVEAEIHERDVHEILERKEGQIAFVTQPQQKFPFKIVRVEPTALPKEGQNMFLMRGSLDGTVQPWWRPGMSGICKVDVEKRTLLWILTHRTMDFLRMFLWW